MTKIKNSVVFILLIVVFTACKVSQDIATPVPELPANFRNAATADTNSIADIKWKSFFTDPSLQKLISKAIAKNYDMQLALKNIEASQLTLKQTKWAYLPDARLQAT
ncbi:MAG TPA: TolC family protein, partial [Segetibacter sp.]|nr:TolC family protein [Segetibacter sp.]